MQHPVERTGCVTACRRCIWVFRGEHRACSNGCTGSTATVLSGLDADSPLLWPCNKRCLPLEAYASLLLEAGGVAQVRNVERLREACGRQEPARPSATAAAVKRKPEQAAPAAPHAQAQAPPWSPSGGPQPSPVLGQPSRQPRLMVQAQHQQQLMGTLAMNGAAPPHVSASPQQPPTAAPQQPAYRAGPAQLPAAGSSLPSYMLGAMPDAPAAVRPRLAPSASQAAAASPQGAPPPGMARPSVQPIPPPAHPSQPPQGSMGIAATAPTWASPGTAHGMAALQAALGPRSLQLQHPQQQQQQLIQPCSQQQGGGPSSPALPQMQARSPPTGKPATPQQLPEQPQRQQQPQLWPVTAGGPFLLAPHSIQPPLAVFPNGSIGLPTSMHPAYLLSPALLPLAPGQPRGPAIAVPVVMASAAATPPLLQPTAVGREAATQQKQAGQAAAAAPRAAVRVPASPAEASPTQAPTEHASQACQGPESPAPTPPSPPRFEFVVRSGSEVMADARSEELPGVREALAPLEPLSAAIAQGVLRLAEGKLEASEADLAGLLGELGLGDEQPVGPPQNGLHDEEQPGPVCALMLRSMLSLAVSAMEGGLLQPGRRAAALARQRCELEGLLKQEAGQQQGAAASSIEPPALELQQQLRAVRAAESRLARKAGKLSPKVLAAFRALHARMAATPHAELRTAASSQAEVAEQLRQSGAFEGRDWVHITPLPPGDAAPAPAQAVRLLAPGAGGGHMRLEGGRCTVSANDGQQVFGAQHTDCGRAAALGRAHLLLVRRMMEQHAELLGGPAPPWSPDNPAHQGLYWLALGMCTVRRQACLERVGYYHAEISTHAPAVAAHLGGAPHPSLVPPPPSALAGCVMQCRGYDVALVVGGERKGEQQAAAGSSSGGGSSQQRQQRKGSSSSTAGEEQSRAGSAGTAAFDPGAWPWQNCTAWCLTDQLCGPALRALASRPGGWQLPILPGVSCGFGIVTAAASLAVHVEDFCGGSTNTCWAGFKIWLYIPPEVLESKRALAAMLMAKQLPPEWLLATRDVLPHVQLALQLPGQMMVIKPGKAYHGVSVPGFCLAEAGNHWHALHTGAPGVAAWLADWCELQERSTEAWEARMGPMWFYFQQLQRILASGAQRAGPAGPDLAAAINQLLELQRHNH